MFYFHSPNFHIQVLSFLILSPIIHPSSIPTFNIIFLSSTIHHSLVKINALMSSLIYSSCFIWYLSYIYHSRIIQVSIPSKFSLVCIFNPPTFHPRFLLTYLSSFIHPTFIHEFHLCTMKSMFSIHPSFSYPRFFIWWIFIKLSSILKIHSFCSPIHHSCSHAHQIAISHFIMDFTTKERHNIHYKQSPIVFSDQIIHTIPFAEKKHLSPQKHCIICKKKPLNH
jgi:hypothetical protein